MVYGLSSLICMYACELWGCNECPAFDKQISPNVNVQYPRCSCPPPPKKDIWSRPVAMGASQGSPCQNSYPHQGKKSGYGPDWSASFFTQCCPIHLLILSSLANGFCTCKTHVPQHSLFLVVKGEPPSFFSLAGNWMETTHTFLKLSEMYHYS